MLKKMAIAVVVLLVALLTYAATKPDTFEVVRSVSIDAPPEKIFPLINDMHKWSAWSPWELKDPGMKRTFSGAASGTGEVYAWEGNRDVGQGSMEIVESSPPSRVKIKLDFVKPFEGHNVVDFTLEPKDGATNVTWSMDGHSPFISKVMQVFVSMDRMIGKDFESGLANLKAAAEKQAGSPS